MINLPRLRLGRCCLSFLIGLSLVLGTSGLYVPARAAISTAVVQEIIDGDEVFIEAEKAELEAIANFQQTVSTEAARAGLLFSNGAAGRLAPNSSVTVGQCIELQQGSILAVGPANGCASGFEIGVEGTVYVLEIDASGSARVKVLEGSVVVKTEQAPPEAEDTSDEEAADPEATEAEATEATGESEDAGTEDGGEIVVEQGQKLTIATGGRPGFVEALLQEEVEAIIYGVLFDGFSLPLPGMGNLRAALESLYPALDIPNYPGFGRIPGGPSLPGPRLPF
ncbi:MAG: FecR domain-containing protein [Spirulinaceae cyanobacterium RM2_2_10]|nr:FecR domain-containing protein [Spirulinaceae cyanobacterium SM2_1_0]NJO20779.1 FecR domain-containing protein [Spirulinaceae cyanobacterium RM2_2_10]